MCQNSINAGILLLRFYTSYCKTHSKENYTSTQIKPSSVKAIVLQSTDFLKTLFRLNILAFICSYFAKHLESSNIIQDGPRAIPVIDYSIHVKPDARHAAICREPMKNLFLYLQTHLSLEIILRINGIFVRITVGDRLHSIWNWIQRHIQPFHPC